jgi:hypothetical protein
MRISRKARLSVWHTLKDGFEDATFMGGVYNVYSEEDLRANVIPVRPFIFLLDFGANFEMKHLPCVVIQAEVHKRGLELGTGDTWYCELILHVLGRNRGERDDLASAIKEEVDAIAIRDFDQSLAPVVQTMQLEPLNSEGDIWAERIMELPQRLLAEGTLANWASLVASFWVTDAKA